MGVSYHAWSLPSVHNRSPSWHQVFPGHLRGLTFVGTHYILGAWYTERELGKRSGIFTSSGLAGTLIGGFIQSGIYKSLHGRLGLAGWRWLFITTTAFYLTEEEKKLAVSRVPEIPEQSPITLKFLKKVMSSWYWWGFVGLWCLAGELESFSTNSLLALFLQNHPVNKYTVPEKNNSLPVFLPVALFQPCFGLH
ncbi:hypothetical protein J3458_019469 [Metarhizium acridum]|uniref:uncharacterized protein n=1 Tax=Metarhizium acridum TaxID=92637 RepID=UPI001C6A9312|nr:hypothetical protein J3458_019469 [Metarhizium acridum]